MKAKVLYFNSKNDARLVTKEIEDGSIIIEDKQFFVDDARPLMLQTKLGTIPLYLLKWNEVQPSTNLNPPIGSFKGRIIKRKILPSKGDFKNIDPKWANSWKKDMTPELIKKMMGLKILGNMIKVKKPAPTGLLFLIIGLVTGALLLYSLLMFKLIPI